MLNALNNYVNTVVVVSIVTSILMAVTPKGSTKAVIGLISGLAVIIALLKPLAAMKNLNLDIVMNQLGGNTISSQSNLDTQNLLKELIADKTSAYILTKAQALDIDCKVTVKVGEGDIPVPESVVISGKAAPSMYIQNELSAFLSFDCGISKENQQFIWK